jgi:beta-glucosidase
MKFTRHNLKKFLVLALFIFFSTLSYAQSNRKYEYNFQNTSLSFEQRVNDLVSSLTLEEKVAQMLNAAPAIPRLGIPAYDGWNKVLHGVARTPYRVTVYPRYVGLTYWTPNINIFRDPRCGRGQETNGEDPFPTAMLGKAFVHELQGNESQISEGSQMCHTLVIRFSNQPNY